jgi:hypothetical protein
MLKSKTFLHAGLLDDLDWSAAEVAAWCEKRMSFAPFYTKYDQFTTTGSQQT